ncbi:MAG: alanyl-tRNA synthetase, alanyl-tRNA synthetase [Parcubacteria group bacterium]|nr:alanyl-tRNA synthetase, alanyl-tRNA synthetase [Parcubacteria group bacterium]
MLSSEEIRTRFLKFFEKRGHKIIPSASLVPENDPSVLFTTAGMHPLVPYLLGQTHPMGKRLANSQKSLRTVDIDEVGDNTHATFFEMLGNWSLGDYFKEDAIKWSYEFLTSKEEGLGLDPSRLYVTAFEGDDKAPRDDESFRIWKSLGMPEDKIYFMGAKSNWWSAGDSGPSGPDTEMFYDITDKGLNIMTKEDFMKADQKQQVVEIWNDVFMEYEMKDGKVVGKLKNKNVDTGSGLERVAMVVQKKNNIFETDLLATLIEKVEDLSSVDSAKLSDKEALRAKRIVADHIRASVFIIADGVAPSNTDRGYVLRRLLRRAVRYSDLLKMRKSGLGDIANAVIQKYEKIYRNVADNSSAIIKEIEKEETKFRETLARGLKVFETYVSAGILPLGKYSLATEEEKRKVIESLPKQLSGRSAFELVTTYGFPREIIEEEARKRNMEINWLEFEAEMEKHQELSRAGSEQKFKGGLADMSEVSIKYHTATHLLHAALREILGDHVLQKGSNITAERLRFDFSHDSKMSEEEKQKVEDIVNQKIKESLPVSFEEMKIGEAKIAGAIGVFGEKYGEVVKVYKIGDEERGIFSMELCGGPHTENIGKLGRFKIVKEEAVSAGVRRIKAVLK